MIFRISLGLLFVRPLSFLFAIGDILDIFAIKAEKELDTRAKGSEHMVNRRLMSGTNYFCLLRINEHHHLRSP